MIRCARSPLLLFSLGLGLWLAACTSQDDPIDAGAPDATTSLDAAPADASADAGEVADAAPADAGEVADAGAADAGPAPLDCSGATSRPVPTDTSTAGPWVVGARTATIAGLPAEVWYPAAPGSEGDQPPVRYDIRAHLPASERGKIPDALNPWQPCDCYRGLPLDTEYGPYPVILFVHGTASFRTQSIAQITHWVRRGFVVVAADHPGLRLRDLLGLVCGGSLIPQDLPRDIGSLLAALEAPGGDLAFLAGHIDLARLGMAGHSAGGGAISGLGDTAAVLVPLAAGGAEPGAALRRTLVMGADTDQVVAYADTVAGYESSPAPKHMVGLANTGHLAFSGLCSLRNAAGDSLVEVATAQGVCGVQLAGRLFDCNPTYLDDEASWRIIDDATSAVFEAELWCRPEALDRLGALEATYGADIAEVRAE